MRAYSKIAYAGAVIGLLKYGSTFGIIVVISYLLPESRQFAVLIESSPEMAFIMGFGLLSGIVGVVVSTIAIITTKKASPTNKKLFVVLLLMGVVFLGMSLASFFLISGIADDIVATQHTNIWSSIVISTHDVEQVYEGMNQSLLVESIPAVLLFISGMLAFRNYRKLTSQ